MKHKAKESYTSIDAKYQQAMEMYRTTSLSVTRICAMTHTKLSAFRSYIQRHQRQEMLARYGIEVSPSDAQIFQLRKVRGQTDASRIKYKEAIDACNNEAYIEYNISQIARMFGLNPTALANQLRAHYPEILLRREQERRRLGVHDNQQRGVRPQSIAQYASAVQHLWNTDYTISEIADMHGVSASGLHEHILFYHKDLVSHRVERRKQACSQKVAGEIMGNGSRRQPLLAIENKYREAVCMFKSSSLTIKDIAARTGVSASGLRNHLCTWHIELLYARYGADYQTHKELSLSQLKHYRKSTAEKYADAIKDLYKSSISTATIAKKHGLHPECFRAYLREHEPELYAKQGMIITISGCKVLRRSNEKYKEAIIAYETSTESLKSIAKRMGLVYNSLSGYIRRNSPKSKSLHDELIKNKL